MGKKIHFMIWSFGFLFLYFGFFVDSVYADCTNIEIYEHTSDYKSFQRKDVVNLVPGASVCTLDNGPMDFPIYARVFCQEDGTTKIEKASDVLNTSSSQNGYYFCKDGIDGDGKPSATFEKNNCANYSYELQNYNNKTVNTVSLYNLTDLNGMTPLLPHLICKDSKTIGYCLNGNIVTHQDCANNICKMKGYYLGGTFGGAECVPGFCKKEDGNPSTSGPINNGLTICRYYGINSKGRPAECKIDKLDDKQNTDCEFACSDNAGNAICTTNSDEKICRSAEFGDLSSGNSYCHPDHTKWSCNENGIFRGGEKCKNPTPYCHTVINGDKTTAVCKEYPPEQASPEEQQYILNITTYSTQEFFCGDGDKSIRTAIGCIPFTVSELVERLLPIVFGITGGIAFLMMVYGFIMISTSSGDEKKVQAAKQIVTSAIIGLLVSVFALFLYKLIAVNILQIPGI